METMARRAQCREEPRRSYGLNRGIAGEQCAGEQCTGEQWRIACFAWVDLCKSDFDRCQGVVFAKRVKRYQVYSSFWKSRRENDSGD